jgi:hypothetical protein
VSVGIEVIGLLKPSSKQIKEWLSLITDYGCVITGSDQIQRHHCVGKSYVKDKVKIGELFVLPLWVELHDVGSNHPFNVTHHRKTFVREYGSESSLFENMCNTMMMGGIKLPFDKIYLEKIIETRR